MHKALLAFAVLLSGCITNYNPTNIIDLTEDQWIEDTAGNRCVEKEMVITSNTIEFYLPGCGVRRVVKPKTHIIPKPKR